MIRAANIFLFYRIEKRNN